jgi:hypothetical protein
LLKTLQGNENEDPRFSVASWFGLRVKKLCSTLSEIVIEEGRLSNNLGLGACCWAKLVA